MLAPVFDKTLNQWVMPKGPGGVSVEQMRRDIATLDQLNGRKTEPSFRAQATASETLARDITRNPRKPQPAAEPKRPRLGWTIDEDSKHWSVAIHESGHAVSVLLNRHAEIQSAIIRVDGSGEVKYRGALLDSLDNRFIALSGLAATWLFNIPDCLHGQDLLDARMSERSQPQYVDRARNDAAKDLEPHRQFIRALAEQLYRSCPEPVSGSTIKAGWQRYCGGARCKPEILFA
ncbi:MAG TPA: hypothetical protein VFG04_08135 [Planctomycetaceae bacterium]|jgi:hypothetical protein|nr:hypothetical protein [Planctomycetaceae bacterium]